MSTRLETARLTIRTFEHSDANDWIAMLSDPDVVRFLPRLPPPTEQTFTRAIETRHAMERELGYSMWAVEDRSSGAFIGQCGIRPVDAGNGPEVDLAYHFARRSWNRGYATEAVIAVLTHGLGPIGLPTVMAVALPENVGSWRAMEKAGMRYQTRADYFGLEGLKKYIAESEWWKAPVAS